MTASEEATVMATVAAQAAASKLADDVVVIDVSGQLVITDCFVIASASNDRQVNAIVDEVEEKMRVAGYKPARREGAREGRWVLLDFVDIVVHIQHQDERNFYALDRLWRDCPVLPVELDDVDAESDGRVSIRRLVMLRHGQTECNAGSRMQGQLDTDLTDLGREQAAAAAEVLAKRQPLVIVSSDLRRALDTAIALGERGGTAGGDRHAAAGNAPRGLAGADASRGGCSGARCAAGLARRRPLGAARRRESRRRGGPQHAVGHRTDRGTDEWGVDEPDRPVVLVAHGGLIAALTAALLGLPVDNWPVLGGMGNASWVQLSGHAAADAAADGRPLAARRVERLGSGRQRCALSNAVAPCWSSATRCRTTAPPGDCPPTTRASGRISLLPNWIGTSNSSGGSAGRAATCGGRPSGIRGRGRRCRGPVR